MDKTATYNEIIEGSAEFTDITEINADIYFKMPKLPRINESIAYGYKITRTPLHRGSEIGVIDCHIGAYGFKTEEDAVKDAISKLERWGIIFKFYIELYSFTLESLVKTDKYSM